MNLTGNNEKKLIEKIVTFDSNDFTNLNTDVKVIEKDFSKNIITQISDNDNLQNIYISFEKSCPTEWVKVNLYQLSLMILILIIIL